MHSTVIFYEISFLEKYCKKIQIFSILPCITTRICSVLLCTFGSISNSFVSKEEIFLFSVNRSEQTGYFAFWSNKDYLSQIHLHSVLWAGKISQILIYRKSYSSKLKEDKLFTMIYNISKFCEFFIFNFT